MSMPITMITSNEFSILTTSLKWPLSIWFTKPKIKRNNHLQLHLYGGKIMTDQSGIQTQAPWIFGQVLYQLSYMALHHYSNWSDCHYHLFPERINPALPISKWFSPPLCCITLCYAKIVPCKLSIWIYCLKLC